MRQIIQMQSFETTPFLFIQHILDFDHYVYFVCDIIESATKTERVPTLRRQREMANGVRGNAMSFTKKKKKSVC